MVFLRLKSSLRILEARQRPYILRNHTEFVSEMLKQAKDATRGTDPNVTAEVIARVINDFADPRKALSLLHERIWNQYTPARCLWEALAWNPDPYKGSPTLKEIPTGGE